MLSDSNFLHFFKQFSWKLLVTQLCNLFFNVLDQTIDETTNFYIVLILPLEQKHGQNFQQAATRKQRISGPILI